MSHHSESPDWLRKELHEQTRRLGIGATGAYPQGVVHDLDEGEIQFAIAADPRRQKVFVNFGKPIDMLGMTKEQALELAEVLQRKAMECQGVTK